MPNSITRLSRKCCCTSGSLLKACTVRIIIEMSKHGVRGGGQGESNNSGGSKQTYGWRNKNTTKKYKRAQAQCSYTNVEYVRFQGLVLTVTRLSVYELVCVNWQPLHCSTYRSLHNGSQWRCFHCFISCSFNNKCRIQYKMKINKRLCVNTRLLWIYSVKPYYCSMLSVFTNFPRTRKRSRSELT